MQIRNSTYNIRGAIRIGTSGWSYDHWRGPFYPKTLARRRWLPYYAQRLRTVEINNSFYRLPSADTLRGWREQTPPGFVFAVKASRYITHMKKLKDPQASVRGLLERITALGERLGPVLFQLPPNWHFDAERLAAFLEALSQDFRYAFEFRDHSWLNERCLDLLERSGAAFCIYDLDGFLTPRRVTADFVYVRLHGPGEPYAGSYGTRALSGWAGAFSSWSRQGREIYCYFDNDADGHAVSNAARLANMLDKA